MGPRIELTDLSLRLQGRVILDGISASVSAGAIHAIVGPNGSGKTSLLRCLLGQMPHSGSVVVNWPKTSSRVIGYVPQTIQMEATLPLTINNFMTIALQRYRPAFLGAGKKLARVIAEALESMGLEGKGRLPLGTLSGGERQRVLFAQALLPSPQLLIADEPLKGLDAAGAELVLSRMRDLATAGTTIIWIAHELELVRKLATEVTGINRELLFSGPIETVHSQVTGDELFSPGARLAARP